MQGLFYLFQLQFKLFINSIKFSKKTERVRNVFIFLISVFLFFCSYIISYQVIIYISTLPVIGTLFIIRILALAFLTSFVMLIFSSLIISFSTLYDIEKLQFLFALPLKRKSIFLFKTVLTSIHSCWMVLILIIPFVAGFAHVKNFSLSGYTILMFSILLKVFSATVIGILAAILLSYLFPSKKIKNVVVTIVIIILSLFYSLFRISQPEKFLSPESFPELAHYLDFISKPVGRWLPSWWLAEIFRGLMVKETNVVVINVIKIAIFFVFVYTILYFLGERIFYLSIFRFKTSRQEKVCVSKPKGISILPLYKAVLSKELKVLSREPMQLVQLVVVLALVIIYIFNVSKLPLEFKYLRVTVSFFNLGGIMFILTALVLRFVFVQPSIELKNFWLIKSSPVNLAKFFVIKIFVYLLLITIPGVLTSVLSNIVLKTETEILIMSVVIIIISSVVLTIAGYSFGILFPKKEYQDIAQIETSFGGLVFILTSVCYILILLSSIAEPVRRYLLGMKLSFIELVLYILLFCIINFAYSFTPCYYAIKKFIKEY